MEGETSSGSLVALIQTFERDKNNSFLPRQANHQKLWYNHRLQSCWWNAFDYHQVLLQCNITWSTWTTVWCLQMIKKPVIIWFRFSSGAMKRCHTVKVHIYIWVHLDSYILKRPVPLIKILLIVCIDICLIFPSCIDTIGLFIIK